MKIGPWWRSLRVRMALMLAGLLSLVLILVVVLVTFTDLRIYEQQAARELHSGELVFRRLLEQNMRQLTQSAVILAADYGFRTAVASQDPLTIQSALINQAQRSGASLLLFTDLQGQVIADTRRGLEGPMTPTRFPLPLLLEQARQKGRAAVITGMQGQLMRLVMVPVKSPVTVGWVTLGMAVDHRALAEFKSLTHLEMSFVQREQGWQMVASTLQPGIQQDLLGQVQDWWLPRQTVQGVAYQSRLLDLNVDQPAWSVTDLRALPQPLVEASPAHNRLSTNLVILQRPLDELLAPFRALQSVLWWLGLLIMMLSLLASVYLARLVTRPIHRLVDLASRIRDGDYQHQIERPGTTELAVLADGLSHMQTAIADREGKILDLLYNDPLTGLLNRAGFSHTLEQALSRPYQDVVVVLLNIDRFQQINDTLGHRFGDQVLQGMAQALTRMINPLKGQVARLGGDEFGIMLVNGRGQLEKLLDELTRSFDQQQMISEKLVDVRASLGIAHAPVHGGSAELLLTCADEAMYEAKGSKSLVAEYHPGKQQFREEHLSLLGDLRRAVEHNELMLYYQPKVNLRDDSVTQAEALIRWQHPERGFISPIAFIPYAEQTGYIRELTRWIICRGCADAALMNAAGKPMRVSINISTHDLLDPTLVVCVEQCIKDAGIEVGQLCLEITESGVMDDSGRALDTLNQLHQLGVPLAIDDYGSGYSSLAYVRQLPVTELKIDQMYIRQVAESSNDAMIVHSTIELAHSLGFKVVAEGVETDAVRQVLDRLGCDYGQGYFFSKPLALDDLLRWLGAREAGAPSEKAPASTSEPPCS